MPPPANPIIREHLAWAYAKLAMGEKAVLAMSRIRPFAGVQSGPRVGLLKR